MEDNINDEQGMDDQGNASDCDSKPYSGANVPAGIFNDVPMEKPPFDAVEQIKN